MISPVAWPCRVVVFLSEGEVDCYRWVIHGSDGVHVASSPYAFATALGAGLSGDLWLREMEAQRVRE